MDKNKKKLGRGLDALFSSPQAIKPKEVIEQAETPAKEAAAEITGKPTYIALGKIQANKKQPRHFFDDEKLEELASSIKAQGVLQPVVVRANNEGYELIAGERRVRASRLAGLETVPAIILDVEDNRMLETALVENLQRDDLNPMEEARGYQALLEDFGLTHEEVARRLGLKRVTVTNTLRLLNLPERIQDFVLRRTLSFSHALVVLSLEDPKAQEAFAQKIIYEKLSVHQATKALKEMQEPPAAAPAPELPASAPVTQTKKDPVIVDFEDKLRQRLGTKVSIDHKGETGGKISLEYYSNADFNRIMKLLGIITEY